MRPPDDRSLQLHHELILDSIAEGVFTVDLNWRITSFNQAAEKITGIRAHPGHRQPCFEVFRADVCETGCVLRRTIQKRYPAVQRARAHLPGRQAAHPHQRQYHAVRDDQGRVIGGVETFQDISALGNCRRPCGGSMHFDDIVSKNEKMLKIFSILPQVAESAAPF